MESRVQILDCSLRDGGYRTNWNFSLERVQSALNLTSKIGVHYFELGFLFPTHNKQFGPFSRVSDKLLTNLSVPANTKLGAMIESKAMSHFQSGEEFGRFCLSRLEAFDFIRIATTLDELRGISDLVSVLSDAGKEVFVNIMRASELEPKHLQDLAKTGPNRSGRYYLADSFGSLSPEKTSSLVSTLVEQGLTVGMHAHNNKGLALANTIAAASAGALFLDGTLAGHGRGSGNTRIEELVLEFNPNDVIIHDLVGEIGLHLEQYEYSPERAKSEESFAFHYGAVLGMHPNYVMSLLDNRSNLSLGEVLDVMKNVWREKTDPSFDTAKNEIEREALQDATPTTGIIDLKRSLSGKKCLLIGASKDREADLSNFEFFANSDEFIVIALNSMPAYNGHVDYVAALHPFREAKAAASTHGTSVKLIFGFEPKSDKNNSMTVPAMLGDGNFRTLDGVIEIPISTALAYGLGLALAGGSSEVILAGFGNGLESDLLIEVEELIARFTSIVDAPKVTSIGPGLSITPPSDLW